MSIKFRVIQKKNPIKPDDAPKWYATAVADGETTLEDLASYASAVSTVSKGDILAVMESCFSKASQDLADGKIVRVGEYFTLQMGLSCEGSDHETEVNSSKIKKCRINFRPGKMLSKMIRLAKYQKKQG